MHLTLFRCGLLLCLFLTLPPWVKGDTFAPSNDVLSTFPLVPADTRSPYSTYTSFLLLIKEASEKLNRLYDHGARSDAELVAEAQYIETLIERAKACFDISGYAHTTRERVGLESVLLMGEILRRTPPTDLRHIPGYDPRSSVPLPERWTIPNTQLTLEKMADGRYLFSTQTVEQLRNYYRQIEPLQAHDPEARDLYQYFEASPGALIPPAWFRLLADLPPAFFSLYADQALWQWLAMACLAHIYIVILLALGYYTKLLRTRVSGPCVLALSLQGVLWLLEQQINLGGRLMHSLMVISELIIWPLLALASYQAISSIISYLVVKSVSDSLKQSMAKVVSTMVSSLTAIIVLSYGATRIGIPVYGIVTSLSLGGMAIALAIRPTLENLIGGVILYLDKAIQVGDYCEFEGTSGTVEAIGIRSTKIRALDRTLITIANGHMVRMKLTNYSRRDKFHLCTTLSVTYDTPAEAMSLVIEDLYGYLEQHAQVAKQPLRVHFARFAPSSLDIDIHAYVYALDRTQFLTFQQQILLDMAQILAHRQIVFAYPSQTLYLQNQPR
ncbi:mechanosensitive ion channel family protein [Vibrio ouci]|uniref:Mechanosensitive ion channel family protein n=1 Tax=Vibrio ouci TaxID=2499078 RepID=A0A4Y8W976_9VIBR|nr:mechanosensitive ion channel family protein [Vibrio ouci]TFH89492.1 mechanosensitive ion channel family protein [Vibrio ouci]